MAGLPRSETISLHGRHGESEKLEWVSMQAAVGVRFSTETAYVSNIPRQNTVVPNISRPNIRGRTVSFHLPQKTLNWQRHLDQIP